ncbi:MAG: hypothetical protein ABIQ95_08120 [Bdellovibrionia bacterium]
MVRNQKLGFLFTLTALLLPLAKASLADEVATAEHMKQGKEVEEGRNPAARV